MGFTQTFDKENFMYQKLRDIKEGGLGRFKKSIIDVWLVKWL